MSKNFHFGFLEWALRIVITTTPRFTHSKTATTRLTPIKRAFTIDILTTQRYTTVNSYGTNVRVDEITNYLQSKHQTLW